MIEQVYDFYFMLIKKVIKPDTRARHIDTDVTLKEGNCSIAIVVDRLVGEREFDVPPRLSVQGDCINNDGG